jgi:hypothetical protein
VQGKSLSCPIKEYDSMPRLVICCVTTPATPMRRARQERFVNAENGMRNTVWEQNMPKTLDAPYAGITKHVSKVDKLLPRNSSFFIYTCISSIINFFLWTKCQKEG